LPRAPRRVEPHELATLPALEYIEVTGTANRAHFEAANFAGVKLDTPFELIPGQRYRVTGFLYPATRTDVGGMPPVGYSGARLRPVTVVPA
jgi:hypothetical protein